MFRSTRVAAADAPKAAAARTRRQDRPAAGPPVRAAVLAAARVLCLEEGVEAVSARRIAAAVGVAPSALYHHFRGLEEILHRLRLEGQRKLRRALERAPREPGGLARLLEMQRRYFRFGLAHPRWFDLLFHARLGAAPPPPESLVEEARTLEAPRAAAEQALAAGEVRSDLDAATIATVGWASVHGVTSLAVAGRLEIAAPGAAETILEGVVAATAAWLRPVDRPRSRRGGGR